LHFSPQSREEKEDTHRAYNFATIKVSFDPKHYSPSPASKYFAWQMGS
jgi:hypothetical protein